jgi:tripeptidyl-peptidase-1
MRSFALAALLPLSLALDTQAPAYSNNWVQNPRAVHSAIPVQFTIVVKEQGTAEVKRIAKAVSDPKSAEYGNYITQEDLDKITAPLASDTAAVTNWLKAEGLAFEKNGVSNLIVTTTVGDASRALSTTFHLIRNQKHGQAVIRAESFDVPASIHAAADAIFGLHGLPLPPRVATVAGAESRRRLQMGHYANVTPAVLWSTYEVPKTTKATKSVKVRQAVAEFQGQFMNGTDLKTLFEKYVKDIDPDYVKGTDDTAYKMVGENIGARPGVEAELDIQYIMGDSPGVKTEFW